MEPRIPESDQKLYDRYQTDGFTAAKHGDFKSSLESFTQSASIAELYADSLKYIHAITPAARALWALGDYDGARAFLHSALDTATHEGYRDEQAITISNLGRVAATEIIKTTSGRQTVDALREEALPNFGEAYTLLRNNPHYYYRYANAHHGSIIAAYAGVRTLSARLIAEGLSVAPKISDEFDAGIRTYKVNPRGVIQMIAAAAIIPAGRHTPVAGKLAQTKLIG